MTYADCDVLGSCEKPVDENAHKGRIETELDRKLSKLGICHTLWHYNCADGDTSNQITHEPLQVVPHDPMGEGKQIDKVSTDFLLRRGDFPDPVHGGRLLLDIAVGAVDREDRLSSCQFRSW